MGVNLVGRSEGYVHAAAVRLPTGYAGREVFIGISDAAVMLFLVFVLHGVGSGIAPLPECFNKLIALFVVRQLLERRFLFIGDDVDDVLVKPFLVCLAQFLPERFR